MDCVYSHWTTGHPDGFGDADLEALRRLVPPLALAIKMRLAGARSPTTLVEIYLGRDAGRRVLSGRIARGVADRINAVLWFSDLRGYTTHHRHAPRPTRSSRCSTTMPRRSISAIHDAGGDVLKLIGDGTLAIFRRRRSGRRLPRALARRGRSARAGRRRSTSGARAEGGRSPRSISACISATCSTATSAASSGSTSPSSARPSTRSAASPRCAARSTADVLLSSDFAARRRRRAGRAGVGRPLRAARRRPRRRSCSRSIPRRSDGQLAKI